MHGTLLAANTIVVYHDHFVNSEHYHVVIDYCKRVLVQGVRITTARSSPNTDGIHVQGSNHVTITSVGIRTGDDCISIAPGTTNLWIEQVACDPGHSIREGGRECDGEDGSVHWNVEWVEDKDMGKVERVVFVHASMQNVHNRIIIDQNYCPGHKGCPNKVSLFLDLRCRRRVKQNAKNYMRQTELLSWIRGSVAGFMDPSLNGPAARMFAPAMNPIAIGATIRGALLRVRCDRVDRVHEREGDHHPLELAHAHRHFVSQHSLQA
ncbi:polygalacturonase-like [Canna indica]|uniref:Polygalacturonase-like n=1 Tax=Canna indica TaxID=4628 RepID=A0AAQ3QF87_9LILI|nr:polygalacturonase-like [Canna indica]